MMNGWKKGCIFLIEEGENLTGFCWQGAPATSKV